MALFGKKGGIDARQAAELVDRGEALLLDVREHGEWRTGHARGATRSGNRSARATESLRRAGLQVENLDGGMNGWRKAGLPLEPPDGRVA